MVQEDGHIGGPSNGRRMLLDFEGIMYVGDVWLNGVHIGGTDYGYVGFEIDVTKLWRYGEDNEIIVKAHTMTEKNSRWYTGGGLFRNVSLIDTPADLYFERHPLYITTRENKYINVSADFTNRTKNRQTVMKVSIYDPQGKLVTEQTAKRGITHKHVHSRYRHPRLRFPMHSFGIPSTLPCIKQCASCCMPTVP